MLLRENWLGIPAWKPKTLGAFCPCATVWKCLSVRMEKVASLWRESPWVHLELFQRMRCTKSLCDQEKTTQGSSQEIKGFLQIIVQNAAALNFSSPQHPAPLTGMGVWRDYPTRRELLFFIICFPPSFLFAFVTAKLVSVIPFWFSVFRILTAMKQPDLLHKVPEAEVHLQQHWKQNAVAEHPPGCTSTGPYPHLPHTTGLKTPNNDLIRLEFLLEPIFCTKVVSALFLNNFWQILFFSFVMKTQSSKPGLTETWQTNSASVLNYHYP